MAKGESSDSTWWERTEFRVTSKNATPRANPSPLTPPFPLFLHFLFPLCLLPFSFPRVSLLFRTALPRRAYLRAIGATVNWGKRLLVLSREEDGGSFETRELVAAWAGALF